MYLLEATLQCPWCWETLELEVDPSASAQDYIEDCQVCCRPIHVRVALDEAGELASVTGDRA